MVEEIAIGRGGMTAAEFDRATPREVQWRIDALVSDEERAWMRTAQLASWVLGVAGAKVSARKLLGKPDNDWRGLLE